MKKTLVIFGLYNTLIEFNIKYYFEISEVAIKPKKENDILINELREIKESNSNIDFYIITNLTSGYIENFFSRFFAYLAAARKRL